MSWLVADDVHEGRAKYNVSDLTHGAVEPEEIVEQIEQGKMPLRSYLLLHPEARLSEAEKKMLIAGLEKTFAGQTGSGDESKDNGNQKEDGDEGAFFQDKD
jgi:hypothetical protein